MSVGPHCIFPYTFPFPQSRSPLVPPPWRRPYSRLVQLLRLLVADWLFKLPVTAVARQHRLVEPMPWRPSRSRCCRSRRRPCPDGARGPAICYDWSGTNAIVALRGLIESVAQLLQCLIGAVSEGPHCVFPYDPPFPEFPSPHVPPFLAAAPHSIGSFPPPTRFHSADWLLELSIMGTAGQRGHVGSPSWWHGVGADGAPAPAGGPGPTHSHNR